MTENRGVYSKDRLADALYKIGLLEMGNKAKAGHYDDYESDIAFPKIQLVHDLSKIKTHESEKLIQRVVDGEFDGTKEETDKWMESEEGQETLREFFKK